LHPGPRDLLAAAFFLPSYAEVAGFWHPPGADIDAVERFALSGYLTGLAGLRGRPAAADPFIAKVAAVVGLPEAIVSRWRGRVPRRVFVSELRRSEGEVLSVYDGTIAGSTVAGGGRGAAGDPLLGPAAAAFGAAFNAYVSEELDYHTDLPYRVLARQVSREWNWEGAGREGGPGPAVAAIEAALLDHPAMRVLIADGRDDLVTPYLGSRWLVDQLQLPEATRSEVRLRLYDGGHMMYLRGQSRRALTADAEQIYAPPAASR
jgi:carboxypeptidase C (cathepsin A)